ncbi:MAG TPA: enoyl-CoA hydratase [Anaerolineae bacterium]|nr:enoyl-CoA hydratase [Anaerolineae bacterium]
MAEYQYVRVSIEDRIATITIDHPPANAFNRQVVEELDSAFDEVTANEEVKAIIITGAGQFFIAGADINEIYAVKDKPEEAKAFIERGKELFNKIEASRKPVIAAINGRFCLGGGTELAMACHIRIAEAGVRIGQPEINLGIMPGWGGTQRLPRLVGKGKALEMLLTGDHITAQEAYRIGLVNKVVPAGQVIREAKGVAKRIASKSALPIAAIIEAVNEGLEKDLRSGLEVETRQFLSLQGSEDMEEGLKAFLEKRKPVFKDR